MKNFGDARDDRFRTLYIGSVTRKEQTTSPEVICDPGVVGGAKELCSPAL